MCGITGFIAASERPVGEGYYAAHRLLAHRGPDDEGFCALRGDELEYCMGDDTVAKLRQRRHIGEVPASRMVLGHRRLSIIDLSELGHQPMTEETGQFVIVYNGEIYNYKELRQELADLGDNFTSQSDTEVILKAVRRWGLAAFNRFNGMWALAVYDKKQDTLILSRDRFGVKPLYYTIADDTLFFASEIKFIRAFVGKGFELNGASARAYMDKCLLNWNEDTFWSGIHELEPASCLIYKAGAPVRHFRYWDLKPSSRRKYIEGAAEEFGAIFEDAIRLRMRSDVEVGCLLSGGLDSNLIVSSLYHNGFIGDNNFQSFSAVFADPRFSEKSYIDSVIQRFGLKGNFTYPSPEAVPVAVDDMLHYLEEPCRSLSTYLLYALYQEIGRTKVKVVLNGEGGDELFAGYTSHYFLLFADLLKNGKLGVLAKESRLFHRFRGYGYPAIAVYTLYQLARMLARRSNFSTELYSEVTSSPLREYLRDDDRTAMAFGIEARIPFLDYRLVEFAFSLDWTLKISGFTNKRIPREYGARRLPAEVINRKDKMGFVSPQEIWQKKELRPYVAENCRKFNRLANSGGLPDALAVYKKISDKVVAGAEVPWTTTWRLVCMTRWLELNKLI